MSGNRFIGEKTSKKDLKELTPLDAEVVKKQRIYEESELIDEMGQVSDLKSKSAVESYFKVQLELDQAQQNMDLELLGTFRKDAKKYIRYLSVIFLRFAGEEDIPKKYPIDVSLTNVGLVIKIQGTKYQGAFKAVGLPSYDRHACKIMSVRLGNTIAKLEGFAPTTEGGIVLPDVEDLKNYQHG